MREREIFEQIVGTSSLLFFSWVLKAEFYFEKQKYLSKQKHLQGT
jgi:hypothetical protein